MLLLSLAELFQAFVEIRPAGRVVGTETNNELQNNMQN